MNISEILFLVLLITAFAGLVDSVLHDSFATRRNQRRDELGVPQPPTPLD